MFERFTRKSLAATGVAVLATLGIGGAAMAQSGKTPAKATSPTAASQDAGSEAPGQESNAPENSATDKDNVQEGDQTGRNAGEKADSGDKADSASEAENGSEKANDDGPGGHADEPGNASADTEQEGQN